jgi:SAM-dependent methyltransferase
VADALCREGDLSGRRVLDVGCGTGRLSELLDRRGATVWGVDPSAEMLAVARRRLPRRVGLKVGRAEELPFRDGWFERAVLWLVVHLVNRPVAFEDVHRILGAGGRVAIATFPTAYFERMWLARFFPSLAAIDRARFPEPEALADELRSAGFGEARIRALSQRATVTREEALARLRGRHISTLQLLPEDEYRDGVARAERELADVTEYPRDWVILTAPRAE